MVQNPVNQHSPNIEQSDAYWRYRSLITEIGQTIGQLSPDDILRNLALDFSYMATALYEDYFLEILKQLPPENDPHVKNHALIDKFQNEWATINQLIAASEMSKKQDFTWVGKIVAAAAEDIGVNPGAIVVLPDFKENFSLLTFAYSKDLAILEIPLTALHTPWEWSVIWHEMAGYRAKVLKAENGKIFHEILEKSKAPVQDVAGKLEDFFKDLALRKPTSRMSIGLLQGLFGQTGLANTSDAWTERNIQELFEDACSVLAFKDDFLPIFSRILGRRPYQNDQKHPAPQIRQEMAHRLLGLPLENNPPLIPEALAGLIIQLTKDKLPVAQKGYSPTAKTEDVRCSILDAIRQYAGKPEEGDEIHKTIMERLKKVEVQPIDSQKYKNPQERCAYIKTEIGRRINSINGALDQCQAILKVNFSEMDELVDVDHANSDKSIYGLNIHGNQHYLIHWH